MSLYKALQFSAIRKRWYVWGIALLVVLFLGQWIARRLEVIEQTHGRLSYLAAARESLSDKTQVVFIGSSHVVGGIRPDSFSVESMNIAGTGFDYFVLEKILRKHLGSMPNLELAVIELDPVPLVIDAVKIRKGDYRAFYVWGLGHNEIPHGANAIVKRISHAVSHIFVPDFRLTPRTVSTTLDQISSSSEKREMIPGFLGSDRVLRPGGGSPVCGAAASR